MGIEETKHDILLRRVQVTIAIFAGLATLVLGLYNIKKSFFDKPAPKVEAPAATKDPVRSALEETAAGWIRKTGSKYTEDK